jgi:hypothetical protein
MNGIAVSADGWTDRNQRHFMGIVVHYITKAFEMSRVTIDLLESGKKGDDICASWTVLYSL